jgi:beta-mannosidase
MVRKYAAKDLYKNVIISPFYDEFTSDLEVYVTSDLWSSASGWSAFSWYDWSGKRLDLNTASSTPVKVDAINTTRVLQGNTKEILKGIDPENAVLFMETSVRGELPNTKSSQEFRHHNWFHPVPLSKAKLVDPGLRLTHLANAKKFRVEATTGIAPWVWLDHPEGSLVHFEMNGFWLRPGVPVEVGYDVKSDTSSGAWEKKVTVQSLWDLTMP